MADKDCKITIVEINHKITMKEVDPIAAIDPTVGIDCKIIMNKIGPITETGYTVEIGCKATTTKMTTEKIIEMKNLKTRDMREGLEITMKMLMKTGTGRIKIGINIETDKR